MHRVYANSTCNISAAASASPEESLFHTGPRNFSMIKPGLVEITLFSTKPELYYVIDRSYWDHQLFDGPLHNRGWVFQERYLSPRVLYFAKNQILWECLTDHKCEVFPCGIPRHWSAKRRDALFAYYLGENIKDEEKMSLKGYRLWNSLVQDYSRCELTNTSDKLFAMAGIAKLFQDVTGDEYVAGLWKSRLLPMMDWWVHGPKKPRPAEYRAPSWSWASVDGPIVLNSMHGNRKFLVDLMGVEVTTRTPDPMSAIQKGSVTLHGRLIPANRQYVRSHDIPFLTEAGKFTPWDPQDALDTHLKEGSRVFYTPFMLKSDDDSNCLICLILEKLPHASSSQDEYRRIGQIALYSRHEIDLFYSKGEVQTIIII